MLMSEAEGEAGLASLDDADGTLLRALLGSDADGIILLGPDAALQVVNAGALRLMEADGLADLAGRPWFDLWSGSDCPAAEAALSAARAGRTGRVQGEGVTSRGRRRCWDAVVRPMQGRDGLFSGFVAVLRDVTELLAAGPSRPEADPAAAVALSRGHARLKRFCATP